MEAVRQGEGGDKTRLMRAVRAREARDGISINQLYNAGEEGLRCVWRAAGRWFDHLLFGSCCCALWITTDTLRLSCTWISVRHNEVVTLCISHSGK